MSSITKGPPTLRTMAALAFMAEFRSRSIAGADGVAVARQIGAAEAKLLHARADQTLVRGAKRRLQVGVRRIGRPVTAVGRRRSEEHTSELQSLMRISYAVFCLKKQKSE